MLEEIAVDDRIKEKRKTEENNTIKLNDQRVFSSNISFILTPKFTSHFKLRLML